MPTQRHHENLKRFVFFNPRNALPRPLDDVPHIEASSVLAPSAPIWHDTSMRFELVSALDTLFEALSEFHDIDAHIQLLASTTAALQDSRCRHTIASLALAWADHYVRSWDELTSTSQQALCFLHNTTHQVRLTAPNPPVPTTRISSAPSVPCNTTCSNNAIPSPA